MLSFTALTQYPASGVDVQGAHTEVASLLLEGQNPYSDMVIPSGSPIEVNQGTIVGYGYPPVSLVMYTAGHVLGDARYTGVVAIVVTLVVVLLFAIRSYCGASIVVGLISTIPLLSAMLIGGWTEPIQAMFLVLSAATYRRWLLSSILLGLAVASKQYMVLVLVPMLVWSIGWKVPAVVAAFVAVTLYVITWRRLPTLATIMLAQAAILGVYFVLAPNSFGNFWFLVAVIAAASIALREPIRSHVGEGSSLSTSAL